MALQGGLVKGFVCHRGVLEDDGDAVVPAAVLCCVIAGLIHPNLCDPAHFHFFLQDGIVVLLEKLEKLVGIAPLGLVVVLHGERLVGRGGRGLRLQERRQGEYSKAQPREMFHGSLLFVCLLLQEPSE